MLKTWHHRGVHPQNSPAHQLPVLPMKACHLGLSVPGPHGEYDLLTVSVRGQAQGDLGCLKLGVSWKDLGLRKEGQCTLSA